MKKQQLREQLKKIGDNMGEYCAEAGLTSELISLNFAKDFVPVERRKTKTPDGLSIVGSFVKTLEIKSFMTRKKRLENLDVLIDSSNEQLVYKNADYRVLHIHVLESIVSKAWFLNRLKNRSKADLIVLFFGGGPIKTIFRPRK